MSAEDREDEKRWHEYNEKTYESLAGRGMILMCILMVSAIVFTIVSLIFGLNSLTSYLFFIESIVVALLSATYVVTWSASLRRTYRAWQQVLDKEGARRRARQ